MTKSTWTTLRKLQTLYSIMIIRDDKDERIFVIESYVTAQGHIPDTFIKGKEITWILTDNSLTLSLDSSVVTNINEKQLLLTRINEVPSASYRFSNHYRYEIWEQD